MSDENIIKSGAYEECTDSNPQGPHRYQVVIGKTIKEYKSFKRRGIYNTRYYLTIFKEYLFKQQHYYYSQPIVLVFKLMIHL